MVNRRIWDEVLGLCYFCTVCGTYKPENDFYKSKRTPWGRDTRCKVHYGKKGKHNDPETEYLRLKKLSPNDFKETKKLLEILGYDTSDPNNSIHQQFLKKHKLN